MRERTGTKALGTHGAHGARGTRIVLFAVAGLVVLFLLLFLFSKPFQQAVQDFVDSAIIDSLHSPSEKEYFFNRGSHAMSTDW